MHKAIVICCNACYCLLNPKHEPKLDLRAGPFFPQHLESSTLSRSKLVHQILVLTSGFGGVVSVITYIHTSPSHSPHPFICLLPSLALVHLHTYTFTSCFRSSLFHVVSLTNSFFFLYFCLSVCLFVYHSVSFFIFYCLSLSFSLHCLSAAMCDFYCVCLSVCLSVLGSAFRIINPPPIQNKFS
jgi:hypothetical protein